MESRGDKSVEDGSNEGLCAWYIGSRNDTTERRKKTRESDDEREMDEWLEMRSGNRRWEMVMVAPRSGEGFKAASTSEETGFSRRR